MNRKEKSNIIVAISGASGSLYAVELLRALQQLPMIQLAIIISDSALKVARHEIDASIQSPSDYISHIFKSDSSASASCDLFDNGDLGARPASGSAGYDAMIIIPCSMKSLASIANGITGNLIERAADVILKERRTLVMVPRETPYNIIHLRNMTALSEAGAIILPASPAFYQKPATLADLGKFIAGKVLGLMGIEHKLYPPWQG